MRFRSLFVAMPAIAVGLACSTTGSERGTATAGTTASTTQPREVGSAGTGVASGDVKGHASDRVITGRIADASGDSLVIESDAGERHTLAVVDQTIVTMDGSESHASALQPGQDVRASYNEQNGRDVAVKVEAMRGSEALTPTPGTPPGATPPDSSRGTPGTTAAPADKPPASGGRY